MAASEPLWQKSLGIIVETNLIIFCRLGRFHMMMNFLGSFGNLIKGSGIEDLFIEVHAETTVNHVMPRKAVSRVLRAHFLRRAVLVTLLLEHVFDNDMIETKRFK